MSLLSRIEKLEKMGGELKPRIVWMEKGDTQAQALSRATPLEPGETPVFIGWRLAE